jgi:hypothetical protein
MIKANVCVGTMRHWWKLVGSSTWGGPMFSLPTITLCVGKHHNNTSRVLQLVNQMITVFFTTIVTASSC